MTAKTIREIALAWKSDKQRYVKQSTYAAYVLILENHLLPSFGDYDSLSEKLVQEFVLQKLENGLSGPAKIGGWAQCKNGKGHTHRSQNGNEIRCEK